MKGLVNFLFLLLFGIAVSCHKDDPGAKQIQFYLSAKAYDPSTHVPEFTTFHVSVTSGRVLADQDETSNVSMVSAADGYDEYTVTVTKSDYITYIKTFSAGDLKTFTKDSPLTVTLLDQSLTNGLVAYYSLDGNASDCSGNHNDGIANGGTQAVDHLGNANGAFQFNGTSDYVSLPASKLENNNYSYSIWVKIDVLPAAGTAVCIFSIGDMNDSKHQTLALANTYGSGNISGMSVGGYNNGLPAQSSNLTDLPVVGIWYHVAGVRNNTALLMYVNGVLVSSADATGTTPYYGTSVAANLGARCDLTQFFKGEIDSFLIYNRAITEHEINVLYKAALPCQ